LNKSEEILKNARESISDFCINECLALCCRSGNLLFRNENEINSIFDKLPIDIKFVFSKTQNNMFTLNLDGISCPKLNFKNLCSIHKDLSRPRVCSDFPIFKVDNYIISSTFCPAINKNLLSSYYLELEDLGFKII